MPVKIFAAPGDHRNDFEQIEVQTNEWLERDQPKVISMHMTVNQLPTTRDHGSFMMTLLVHHESK